MRADRQILRELAKQMAEIAGLPVQEETRALWRALNRLKPERPMVMIDQVCWNEMNFNDELTLRCEDPECREYEKSIRKQLYQWKHFRADMVVEPYIAVQKAVYIDLYGVAPVIEAIRTDPTNDQVAMHFTDVFITDEDLDKICLPKVRHDAAETARRMSVAHDIFDGVTDVAEIGVDDIALQLWDPISRYKSVQNVLYDLADRPEFVHKMVGKMCVSFNKMLDELEEQGLLAVRQNLVHCTGAYTDELPKPGYNPAKPRIKDMWIYGLAQMFATVSPEMHQEFELDYIKPICERFGLVYYGCCDPLDLKLDIIKKIPNLRKISMSPWIKSIENSAENIGGDFVYSRKPNPALLAFDTVDEKLIRDDLTDVKRACEKYGCPLEFILKDISTVKYEPERLWRWAEIAMDIAKS
jgi:hypothetical protein